jgi:hypothetical protein
VILGRGLAKEGSAFPGEKLPDPAPPPLPLTPRSEPSWSSSSDVSEPTGRRCAAACGAPSVGPSSPDIDPSRFVDDALLYDRGSPVPPPAECALALPSSV